MLGFTSSAFISSSSPTLVAEDIALPRDRALNREEADVPDVVEEAEEIEETDSLRIGDVWIIEESSTIKDGGGTRAILLRSFGGTGGTGGI